MKRHLMLGLMVVFTGWSVWAWAEPSGASLEPPSNVGEGDGPAPVNWFEFGRETPPFIATIVNFGILAAGFYLFGRKPIAGALQARRDSIAKEIEEAQQMRREAEARAEVYQAKLEKLETEAKSAREALQRAGEAERDRIVADAEAKVERMHKDAQFLVEQEFKQIRQELWRDTLDVAIAAAEGVLRSRVTDSDQERLAEEYLADLGGKPKGERITEPPRAADPGAGSSP